MDGSTHPFIGSWCSLVWERRTTCWVTMRVPDPNILVIRRPPPFREGRDLDHHVAACGEGTRACWMLGGGGGAGPAFGPAPFLLGGVGAANGLLPVFWSPRGTSSRPAPSAEIGADREVGGGGGAK